MRKTFTLVRFGLLTLLVNLFAPHAIAQSPYEVHISTSSVSYPSYAAMLAFEQQHGVDFCHLANGYPSCEFTGFSFQSYYGQVPGSYSTPPFGDYSSSWIAIYPHVKACRSPDGTDCTDDTGGWGVFYTDTCPVGEVWETKSDGTSVCAPIINVNLDRPYSCPAIGRPIYPLTGVQRHDIDLGMAIGGTPLTVTFDTRDQLPEANGNFPWVLPQMPSFGAMWQSNVHRNLQFQGASQTPGAGYTSATVQMGANNNVTYSPSGGAGPCSGVASAGGATYTSSIEPAQQLTFSGTAAHLLDQKNLIEQVFDSTGALNTVSNAQGGGLTYAYNASVTASAPVVGLLTSVTDQFGRSVQFAYEQPALGGYAPRITTVTGPDGQVTTASYDPTFDNLIGLTWPDSLQETFVYERSDLPWAMTGIVDESGVRYVTLGYDSAGRANSSQEGTGSNSFTVQYDPSPAVAPHWSVSDTFLEDVPVVCRIRQWQTPQSQPFTNPAGQSISYGASSINGMPALLSQSQPAGSGCAASSSAQGYDAAGNVTSHDDFDGNRSCYAYDLTRNLQTIELDGLPNTKTCPATLSSYAPTPADAAHPERKTTTVWHPDWALKAQEAQPKKITTWVYNGQPDPIGGGTASCAPTAPALPDGKPIAVVCSRYDQATTDATGALGLSATVTGVARKWSFTYNQFGQLLTETAPKQSATDSLSHATTYTYYSDTSMTSNAGHTIGDLQSLMNPLGQVTTFTSYDGAGRLLSSTDANGAVTTQTYWPRGWIKTQTVTPLTGATQTTSYAYYPTGLLQTVTMPDNSTLNYAYDAAHRLTDITDAAGNKMHYVLDNLGNRTSEQVSDASGNLASSITRVFDALNRVQTQTGIPH